MITGETSQGGTDEIGPELMALRLRRLELARKRLEAVKKDGLPFYAPHPKQDAFHRAEARRRLCESGNRFGKSHMGCAEDAAWLRGERVWYPLGDPARTAGIPQRPVKGLVITTDWDTVDEVFTSERGESGKLWRYLPSELVKSKSRNHSGTIATIELRNGSLLRFDTVKSWMSNPLGSESRDWDFIHVDEPCPEGMWKSTSRGLIDRGGWAWFTLTPLSEWWIDDFFAGKAVKDGFFTVRGSIYDNPYLEPQAVADFEQSLTEDEKQCRLFGLPLHKTGLIYKEFRQEQHELRVCPRGWASITQPPKDYSIYVGIDPHPQTPHAVLFCAVNQLGQRFYYRDIFEHCSIAELARQIKEVVAGYHVVSVRVDPLAYINDPITESNMAEEFIRCGVMVEKATKALAQGVLKVQAELKKDNVMHFGPGAKRTLWEIARYMWNPKKPNSPIDANDHMMENLYRIELDEPKWYDRPGRSVPIPDITITGPDFAQDYEEARVWQTAI